MPYPTQCRNARSPVVAPDGRVAAIGDDVDDEIEIPTKLRVTMTQIG